MMKIEKITENKIRITLNLDDLKEKNIDFHSFMSNSEEAQNIFFDMLKEAEEKIGFKTDDYKIMLEALATPDGNFILNVTRLIPDTDSIRRKNVTAKRKSTNIDKKLAVYKFETFEDFCEFSNLLHSNKYKLIISKIKKAILYLYNGKYYLVLNNILADLTLLKSFCSLTSEFCSFMENSDLLEKKLTEYGKVIIKNNAIATCCKYFN